ncbi:hypothetical protein [Rodentibacter pneumotropicus]|uniref:Uncharacterized protein n=1 Tax=Rodentibacter pneumotropicus TaxID=758 RepID=A0A4S2PQJ2_9PAST|nr:hypothetical protein [Rodentibacter pneumotropicus]THA05951.1 hypothetical protein D3M78_11310 [Rodentibacter pneumotropicus]
MHQMKEYTFTYHFEGQTWVINIFADTPKQAKEKIKAVSQATYEGEITQSIHIPIKDTSWLAKAIKRIAQQFSSSTKSF